MIGLNPFDAQAWLARWTAAGGSYAAVNGKAMLCGIERPDDPSDRFLRLGELHAELGEAERSAVRVAICNPSAVEACNE